MISILQSANSQLEKIHSENSPESVQNLMDQLSDCQADVNEISSVLAQVRAHNFFLVDEIIKNFQLKSFKI